MNRVYESVAMYPSGCPTCSPDPDGYGNMFSTYIFGAPARGCPGSPNAPLGFGASNVPRSSQYPCQRSSISPASAAVYRYGGMSASVIVLRHLVVRSPGHEKTPHAGGVRRADKSVSTAP